MEEIKMADKASGVYLTITDNSIQTSGGVQMKVVVPMRTLKGDLGLNRVTATNFEDILGYDLNYNSNYYGLRNILSYVTYADVWRVNQNAYFGNAYVTKTTTEGVTTYSVSHETDLNDFDTLLENEDTNEVVLGTRYPTEANVNVRIRPAYKQVFFTSNATVTVSTPDINFSSVYVDDGQISSAIKICDLNGNVIAVVGSQGTGGIHQILDYYNHSVVLGTFQKNNDDTVTLTIYQTLENNVANTILAHGTMYRLDYFGHTDCTLQTQNITNTSIINNYSFSLDENSEDYWKNVDFGYDVQFFTKETSYDDNKGLVQFQQWQQLSEGSVGDGIEDLLALDTSVLDSSGDNILAFNGYTTDTSIINKILTKCESLKIHAFVDAPAYKEYSKLLEWKQGVYATEYASIGCRPDVVNGIYVYPSVSYVQIYSNMMSKQGNLNYPPAGITYGTIPTSNLLTCDYEMYADEMKTNRLNWQRIKSNTAVMWEQRTTYGLNSDLSYIAPTFIIDDLSQRLIDFESNFNFRYMTRDDILLQQTGLTSILDEFVSNNFLYSYELKMPTYEEAQKGGRTLNIPINVVIMKDSEVIYINLQLNNA